MSTLHLVNRAYPASNALAECLTHCRDGDTVLLIEDGVYAAQAACWSSLECPAGLTLALLAPDADARGVATDRLAPAFRRVDYDGFVTLAATHQPIVTWF